MITVAGNPQDYILVFGGTSVEALSGYDTNAGVFQIKLTLDDFWVFNVREKLWQPIYPNSKYNPNPSEMGKMITLEADRLILMFGGAYGELLNKEIWLYNINTNLW